MTPSVSEGPAALQGRILVVEDDPHVRAALVDCLELLGHQVESAADGGAGLERILGGGFDLVLLDLQLPVRSGLDVLASLQARKAGVPVVVLTGTRDLEMAQASVRLGARDYLPKPFDIDQLKRTLQWHLSAPRRQPS